MPEKMESIVKKLKRKGMSNANAYAVANSVMKKAKKKSSRGR